VQFFVSRLVDIMALPLNEIVERHPDPVAELSVDEVREAMRGLTGEFMARVEAIAPVEPAPGAARETTLDIIPVANTDLGWSDWRPSRVWQYNSSDPYHNLNPELVQATDALIEGTMDVTEQLDSSVDPGLAYLDPRRARKGATVPTQVLRECDPEMGKWMEMLPAAECLQPVAHPWSDKDMVVWDEANQTFVDVPNSPALRALGGASNDGRGVREREAFERMVVSAFADGTPLPDNTLRITSLGTGTGEPAIDSGLAAMHGRGKVVVRGVDNSPGSLRIAEYLAARKQAAVGEDALEFTPVRANLLEEDSLAAAVREAAASVYEAVGFAEYAPSERATDSQERGLQRRTGAVGLLSAEGFYRTVYANMPSGSILVTGNIRRDSPQARFVTEGLGWPYIMQRGTQEYLAILRNAGIPGENVQLFVPGEDSAGVYNLVVITKP
jgi:hypothetical protein